MYDQLKAFYSIVLLNTLGKLIEKVVADRLQFIVACNNFTHPSQLGSLKFKSTIDTGIALTHIVWSGWAKEKSTSSLVFNISQFFPSLNHKLLVCILEKASLDPRVLSFFVNYLVKRRTSYMWNTFSSPMFDVNIGVGQESVLSPILSSLYLTPFLYILEKHLKNLKIPISILSFVDDGLIIAQNKSFDVSTLNFFVVTMFFLNYLTVSVSLLNIQRLKFFILVDLKVSLIYLLWTFPHLEDQYYDPKTPGSTWVSSSIASSISTSILTTMLTRPYQLSSV